MSLITQRIATRTFQIALPGGAEDHDKGRSKSMLFFKLVPLPVSHKPRIIEEGIKDNGPVLWRKVLQNIPEQFF